MRIKIFVITFLVAISIHFMSPPAGIPSPWSFNLDLKYEKTDKTLVDQEDETYDEIQHEYQIRYDAPLSSEGRLESELRAKFEQENRENTTYSDLKTFEPYAMFRLKSRLYEFRMGYKELKENTNITTNTTNGFFDLELQPEYLPELDISYDFEKQDDPNVPLSYLHKFSINSLYNIKNSFKIRLNYQGEMKDYDNSNENPGEKGQETKETNFLGQITFKHYIFGEKVSLDLDYKLEKEHGKEQDPNNLTSGDEDWRWNQDSLSRTAITKITYQIMPTTKVTTHYENKNTDNKLSYDEENDEQKDTFWMDINQKLWPNVTLIGKYKYEKDQLETEDQLTDTYEAEVSAAPRQWLDLRGRAKFESRDINDLSTSNIDKEEYTQSMDGTWKSYFPNLFNASNTFNVKFVKEEEDNINSAEEEHYKWQFQLTPIVNLTLTPEYNISQEDDFSSDVHDNTTHEFKTNIKYSLQFASRLLVDLGHTMGRKRSKGEEKNNRYLAKEYINYTTLNMRFTPTRNLIVSSQIIRDAKKTTDSEFAEQVQTDEVNTAYALNGEWRFDPFTWSNSIKYDDRDHKTEPESGTDEESFESKITYKINKYDFTANYKYTKIYSENYEKEQRIGLEIRAYY